MNEQDTKVSSLSLPVLAGTVVLVASMVASVLATEGFNEQGVRLVLRNCARISFTLFLLVFIASPLATLLPGRVSRWLVAHRATLGLSFALSHLTMGVAILTYRELYTQSFYEVTYPLQRIGGAVGFAAIAFMAVTTFEGPKQWLGMKRWKLAHTVGLYFLFINFLVSQGRRAILNQDSFYLPFLVLLLAGLALRVASAMKVQLAQRRSMAR